MCSYSCDAIIEAEIGREEVGAQQPERKEERR